MNNSPEMPSQPEKEKVQIDSPEYKSKISEAARLIDEVIQLYRETPNNEESSRSDIIGTQTYKIFQILRGIPNEAPIEADINKAMQAMGLTNRFDESFITADLEELRLGMKTTRRGWMVEEIDLALEQELEKRIRVLARFLVNNFINEVESGGNLAATIEKHEKLLSNRFEYPRSWYVPKHRIREALTALFREEGISLNSTIDSAVGKYRFIFDQEHDRIRVIEEDATQQLELIDRKIQSIDDFEGPVRMDIRHQELTQEELKKRGWDNDGFSQHNEVLSEEEMKKRGWDNDGFFRNN